MSTISIRKSGGASIVSLPKSILTTLGLAVGSKLDLRIDDGQIVLKPLDEMTLEHILANSPKERLHRMEEDQVWLDSVGGKEF